MQTPYPAEHGFQFAFIWYIIFFNLFNFLLVSATTIAWVQAIGIVAGHIGGVLAAHDRALEVYDKELAVRSQLPLVGVMIIYTVGALVLLLGA